MVTRNHPILGGENVSTPKSLGHFVFSKKTHSSLLWSDVTKLLSSLPSTSSNDMWLDLWSIGSVHRRLFGEWMEVFLLISLALKKGADFCHFTDPKTGEEQDSHHELLLMVQNSGDHHLGWCKNPENNGKHYQPQLLQDSFHQQYEFLTHFGPWSKHLNFIFPAKYHVVPESVCLLAIG